MRNEEAAMRRLLAAAVVVMAVAAEQADAKDPRGEGLFGRGVIIDRNNGSVIPATTRLHPVIGSTQVTSHFNLPFTHKARYSTMMYNPLLGSFSSRSFKR
jgi:hypothetical protein